jgi:PAS domain S-box-containing protein
MTDNLPFMVPELAMFSLEHSRDTVFWILSDGRLCYANNAACTELGYSREELLKMSIQDIDPTLNSETWPAHWNATNEKKSSLIEAYHRRKDGTVIPVQVAVNYLLYGGREYHCSIARDMSGQKRSEQILREQSRVLRLLMIAAVSANEASNIRQALRHVIDEICKSMEWPVGAAYLLAPGADYLEAADIIYANDPGRYDELMKLIAVTKFKKGFALIGGVFASGRSNVMQLHQDMDIRQYPLAVPAAKAGLKTSLAFPIKIAAEVVGVLVFASESPYFPDEQLLGAMGDIGTQLGRIIERKQAELALQKSQASLALAQRIAHIGSWEWDLVTGALVWSDEVYRIFGVIPGNFQPTNAEFLEMLPPDERPLVRRAILKAIEGETPYDIEHGIIQPGGVKRMVREQAEVFRDEQGRPVKVAGSIQDITDAREAQSEREQLLRTLAAKNEELESIIYASSHDLRNPLVNIQGFSWELARDCKEALETARAANLPPEVMEKLEPLLKDSMPASVEYIIASVRKMDDLLRGLLRLSRLERDAVPSAPVDVNRLLASILDSMSYRIEQAGVQVTVGELPPCRGDVGQLVQLFSHLIDNAIKYRAEGRQAVIKITGQTDGQMRIYRVEDNGQGIAQVHREKVFEIFHRLNPQGGAAGEGLGLTIVRRIVQRHGGSVRLESEEGKGSTFIITLPG